MLRHLSDRLRNFGSLLLLLPLKFSKSLDLDTILFHVDDAVFVLHILAVFSVSLQDVAENRIDAE